MTEVLNWWTIESWGKLAYCTLPCRLKFGNSAPSLILTCRCATSTQYMAEVTLGFSESPLSIAAESTRGARRAPGEAGAGVTASARAPRRYFAREVARTEVAAEAQLAAGQSAVA